MDNSQPADSGLPELEQTSMGSVADMHAVAKSQARVRLSFRTEQILKKHFPDESPGDALEKMTAIFDEMMATDPGLIDAELLIRITRLEDILSLLAATNIEIGQIYRSLIGREVERIRKTNLAVAASVNSPQ